MSECPLSTGTAGRPHRRFPRLLGGHEIFAHLPDAPLQVAHDGRVEEVDEHADEDDEVGGLPHGRHPTGIVMLFRRRLAVTRGRVVLRRGGSRRRRRVLRRSRRGRGVLLGLRHRRSKSQDRKQERGKHQSVTCHQIS